MDLLSIYIQRQIRRERHFRDRLNPLEFYNDCELQQLFRFNRTNIIMITRVLEDQIENSTGRNHSLSCLHQVCIALRFFATGSMQLSLGAWIHVEQSTVSRVLWKVTRAIIANFPETFVINPEKNKAGFFEKYKIPNIFGAIDCTHIKIQRPPDHHHPDEYLNRKNYYSFNVQAVCDSDCIFTDIVVAWPGSVHDSRIFKNSNLYNRQNTGEINGILLGDSGYALSPFLLTPFSEPQCFGEERYNKIHKKARCTIERSFGQLKRRFHCLGSILRCKLDRVGSIITACFILHNVAKHLHEADTDDYEALYIDDHEEIDIPAMNNDAHVRRMGEAKRREIMEFILH